MPDEAPLSKMARTRELGGSIITYHRATQVREEVAERIQANGNNAIMPPTFART
jgi:threonine dehydratase